MDPRAPNSRTVFERAVAWTVVAQLAVASIAFGSGLDRIDQAEAAGRIARAEAARQRFFYLFDRRRLSPRWGADGDPPAKCGTRLVARLRRDEALLDREMRATLEAPREGLQGPGTSSYTTAHFRIDYATSGPDAPVPTDLAPQNGIPDFVESTGAACEQAWAVEVAQLGYTAPAIGNGQSARYPVTYQAQSAYGYTTVVSGQQTRMVLNPNYAGFPFNDDPEGDVVGALRATVAHELKHAIQYMYTPWTEGNWIELDATWVEDVVFDQVNDYVNFVRTDGSPFTAPGLSLFLAEAASYEDCNWETYLAATLGTPFLRSFWERRRDFLGESVLLSWQQSFQAAGTDLASVWRDYVAWNFATGEHAVPGFGYEESATYPTTPATFVHEHLPIGPISWPVNGTAASAHLFSNPDATLGGMPEFTFAGAPGNAWGVSLLIRRRSGGLIDLPLTLAAGSATVQVAEVDWSDIEWAALVIGNPTPANPPISYSVSARAIAPILISHDRLSDRSESGQPPVVSASIAPGTSTPDPGAVTLLYRVNSGAISSTPMTPSGAPQQFAANLPLTVPGTHVEYRIEARSASGAVVASPSVPGAFHGFDVMTLFEPFEAADGWTVGDAGDDAVSGRWERVVPRGTAAAPYLDATRPPSSACFVTQNGSVGGISGEADVDGGKTTLRSPTYCFGDRGHYARVEARYRRWYVNDVGARPDDAWRVDASNDGGATWVHVETAALGESRWVPVTIDLLATFAAPDCVQFRFVAEDRGNSSLVEAGVDDFELLALPSNPVSVPAGPPPRLALGPAIPNPARGPLRLRLSLSREDRVWVAIRDVQGRLVRRILDGDRRPAGGSWIEWDGRTASGSEAAAGLYWVDARSGDERFRRQLVRLASGLAAP